MKYYSEKERDTAKRTNELQHDLFESDKDWDSLTSELKIIFSEIPDDYKNSFEENKTLYMKFWDQEEFINYVEVEKPTINVEWLANAYPFGCYLLSIILIERGEYDDAYTVLNKGLELERDNPLLLDEMGVLLGRYAQHTQDEKYLHQALELHMQAFDSRTYNTPGQKARSLRGAGFIFIDLKDFDNAEKYYEASLTWEDSERAHSELSIIREQKETPDFNIFAGVSNLNKVEDINSYEYFEEQVDKLPKKFQDIIPSKYVYIWTKAARLFTTGPDNYRLEDYFHFPLEEWDLKQLQSGVVQIVEHIKGISPGHYIELDTMEDVENLMLTFHFVPINKNIIDSKPNHILLEIEFEHKMDNSKVVLYFEIIGKSDKKSWWNVFEELL